MDARKKTKAQLLAELETLQHSAPQDMLRLVIESLDEGLLVADPRGVVRFANRPFADVWRMPEPPSPGSAMGDLAAALDPLGARAGEVRGALLDSIPGERRQLRLHDGRVLESSMLTPPAPGVEHRVWCFRDVTERAALEERTRHSHKLEAI
ncbi:MAG TPA: PAS domain-containing protein, partial [Polyangiaceae bacterium]|nr:PAS domain-containing protein [Polyangiaceae bacterium]